MQTIEDLLIHNVRETKAQCESCIILLCAKHRVSGTPVKLCSKASWKSNRHTAEDRKWCGPVRPFKIKYSTHSFYVHISSFHRKPIGSCELLFDSNLAINKEELVVLVKFGLTLVVLHFLLLVLHITVQCLETLHLKRIKLYFHCSPLNVLRSLGCDFLCTQQGLMGVVVSQLYLRCSSIFSGVSRYSLHRLEKRHMVAPSMMR